MNKYIQNGLFRISEDVGCAPGAIIGTVLGIIDAAILPTYIRKQLTATYQEEVGINKGSVYDVQMMIEPFPENATLIDKVDHECRNRFNAGMAATKNSIENLVRMGSVIAASIDLADGKMDNAGYLAIPAGISLVYEGTRLLRNQFKKKK